jgi:hypothetical protein
MSTLLYTQAKCEGDELLQKSPREEESFRKQASMTSQEVEQSKERGDSAWTTV